MNKTDKLKDKLKKYAKYAIFSVVIHPKGGNEIDWKALSGSKKVKMLNDLKFLTPSELGKIFLDTRIFTESKKTKSYYSEMVDFGGQLEIGDENEKPHYQCWIQLSSKVTCTKVVKYFSNKIYKEDNSTAISVLVLSQDPSDYKKYCNKEKRANLTGKYKDVLINKNFVIALKYLEDNPEAKKYIQGLISTKNS